MLLALVDLVKSGFVMLKAEATLDASGGCTLAVSAAGSGLLQPAARVAQMIERLGLSTDAAAGTDPAAARSATGTCPNTGAPIHFAFDANEGVLLRMEFSYARTAGGGEPWPMCPPASHAWVIEADAVKAATLERRLQRFGWIIRQFVSCSEALAQTPEPGLRWASPAPALLIVIEPRRSQATEADELQRRMPPSTQRVYAVIAGSPTLGLEDGAAAFELHVIPFSPAELSRFCERASPEGGSRFAPAEPPGEPAARPRVLIVDDNEINRIVGQGLVEALGYEVRTAHDGLDAIGQCRLAPPQLLLMDLDMPVLNGIDATSRLRELQREGGVAPFPILAATADATAVAKAACRRVGMDGFLTKPLQLDELREELRRLIAA